MTAPHAGGCRCGAVRFEASAEPHHVSYCHCGDCRRASGAPVSAFVGFPVDKVMFTGKSLKMYENGPVTRSFCAICGSPIAYVDDRLEDDIYFMLGAMDMPAAFTPTQHAYVGEQLPFLHMSDDLPRHLKTSVTRPDGTVP
ncbi:GFA family protein [Mesorhizobium erdmanii]|uniref:GFA family protein n=1 Tax=Mesorhizobium erdmanii TaxID=1777866 RepID=UPI00047C196C|nr:GFA family protein [Mesorhizobium erdmanii]